MSAEASPSPRPSLALASPSSSSRTSLDQPPSTNTTLPGRPQNSRRNRAALRDYYGIKATSSDNGIATPQSQSQSEAGLPNNNQGFQTTLAELDAEGFDAAAYVKALLEKESLETVLRTEGALVGEIRALDGERKALVYDNYSKLIAATETIRKVCVSAIELVELQNWTGLDCGRSAGAADGSMRWKNVIWRGS
jgi:hypothetical protein